MSPASVVIDPNPPNKAFLPHIRRPPDMSVFGENSPFVAAFIEESAPPFFVSDKMEEPCATDTNRRPLGVNH